ncbi:protein ACCELERATED CELL DEATH 6 [Hevea brasiliensis]|nr:protein ACCELERATED CELL DEATH 6 [Hevea brasiliensis]
MALSIHVDEEGSLERRSKQLQELMIAVEGKPELEQSVQPGFIDQDLCKVVKEGNVDNFLEALATVSKNLSLRSIFDQAGPSQNSLLHLAVNFNKKDIAELIACHFPELISKRDVKGNTALHFAARMGILKTVEILVRHANELSTADVSSSSSSTPKNDPNKNLETSSSKNRLAMMKNKLGNTALHEAVMNDHSEVARFLVLEDREVWYFENEQGWSPMCLAIINGNQEILRLLLELQPPATRYGDVLSRLQGNSPAHVAIYRRCSGMLEEMANAIPELILFKDAYGRTPLHCAAQIGELDAVDILVRISRSIIFEKDNDGYFPIHIASKCGHIKVIKKLVKCWPNPEELLTEEGRNILHIAAMNGKDNVVRYILATPELRKILNEKDNNGDTPLHLAAGYCHPGVVLSLTRHKEINLHVRNNEMLSPFGVFAMYKIFSSSEEIKMQYSITGAALSSAGCKMSHLLGIHKEKRIPRMHPELSKNEWMKEQVAGMLTAGTLVATGTFAAGFALPGGYNPDKGTATLINNHMFQLFMICNTASFYCSIICLLCCAYSMLADVHLAANAFDNAKITFGVALLMMSLAFMAALHAVAGNLSWLASLTLIMGTIALLTIALVVLFFLSTVIIFPSDWILPLMRFVSYYIHRLMVFVLMKHYHSEPPAYLSKQSSSENMNEKSNDMDEKEAIKQVGIEE